jgi:hypothetical protein
MKVSGKAVGTSPETQAVRLRRTRGLGYSLWHWHLLNVCGLWLSCGDEGEQKEGVNRLKMLLEQKARIPPQLSSPTAAIALFGLLLTGQLCFLEVT